MLPRRATARVSRSLRWLVGRLAARAVIVNSSLGMVCTPVIRIVGAQALAILPLTVRSSVGISIPPIAATTHRPITNPEGSRFSTVETCRGSGRICGVAPPWTHELIVGRCCELWLDELLLLQQEEAQAGGCTPFIHEGRTCSIGSQRF
jgi:hypothetical protein